MNMCTTVLSTTRRVSRRMTPLPQVYRRSRSFTLTARASTKPQISDQRQLKHTVAMSTSEPAFCPAPVDFQDLPSLIARHARQRPHAAAMREGDRCVSHAELDALSGRVAATLQRDGLAAGDCVALCAATCIEYVAVFLGALRAGAVVAPLAPSATPAQLAAMVALSSWSRS